MYILIFFEKIFSSWYSRSSRVPKIGHFLNFKFRALCHKQSQHVSTRKKWKSLQKWQNFCRITILTSLPKRISQNMFILFRFCKDFHFFSWSHAVTKRAKFEIQKMAYFGTLPDREYQFEQIFWTKMRIYNLVFVTQRSFWYIFQLYDDPPWDYTFKTRNTHNFTHFSHWILCKIKSR